MNPVGAAVILVALFGASGCDAILDIGLKKLPHRGDSGIWIEPGISQTAVMRGCQVWGVDCLIVDSYEAAHVVIAAGGEPDCAPAPGGGLSVASGTSNGSISLRMACWPDVDTDWGQFVEMASVIAHELGHTMGLAHVPEPDALMNAVVPPVLALTDADRREFLRVRGTAVPADGGP